jgi:hypothetical protein
MFDNTIKKIFEANAISGYLYLQKTDMDDATLMKLLSLKPGEINIILSRAASFIRNDSKDKSRKELINEILEVLERSAVARKFVSLGLKQDYRLFRGFPVRKGDTYESLPAPGTDIALKPTEVYIGWSTDPAKAREEGVTYDATKGEPVGGLLVEGHVDSNKTLFDINAVLNAVKAKLNVINQYNSSAAPGKSISKTNTDFLATEAPAYHGQWEVITSNKIVNVRVIDKWTWDADGNQKVPRWIGDAQPKQDQQPTDAEPEQTPATAPTPPQTPQQVAVQENIRKLFEEAQDEYCDACDSTPCQCNANTTIEESVPIFDDKLDEGVLDKLRGVTDWIKKTAGVTIRGKTLKYMDMLYKQHATNRKVYELAHEFAQKKSALIDASTEEGKQELADVEQKIEYAENQILLINRLMDDVKEGYIFLKKNPDRAVSFAPVTDQEAEKPDMIDPATGDPRMRDDLKDVDDLPFDPRGSTPTPKPVSPRDATVALDEPLPFEPEAGPNDENIADQNQDDDQFELDKGITLEEDVTFQSSLRNLFNESVETLEILKPVTHSKYGTVSRPGGKELEKLFNKLIAALYKHYGFRIKALELQKELLEADYNSYKGGRWANVPSVKKLGEMVANTEKSLQLVTAVRKKLDDVKTTAKDFSFASPSAEEPKKKDNDEPEKQKSVAPIAGAEAAFRRAEGALKAAEAGEKKSDQLDNDENIVKAVVNKASNKEDDIIDWKPEDSKDVPVKNDAPNVATVNPTDSDINPEVVAPEPAIKQDVAKMMPKVADKVNLPPELLKPKKVARKPKLSAKAKIEKDIQEKGFVEYSPMAAQAFKTDHPDWKEDATNPKKIKFFPPQENVNVEPAKVEPVVPPTPEPVAAAPEIAPEPVPEVKPEPVKKPVAKAPKPAPKPAPVVATPAPAPTPVAAAPQPVAPTKLAQNIPLPNPDVDSYMDAYSKLGKVKAELDEHKRKLPNRVNKAPFQEIVNNLEREYSNLSSNVKRFGEIVGIPPSSEEFKKLGELWQQDRNNAAEIGKKKRKKR